MLVKEPQRSVKTKPGLFSTTMEVFIKPKPTVTSNPAGSKMRVKQGSSKEEEEEEVVIEDEVHKEAKV